MTMPPVKVPGPSNFPPSNLRSIWDRFRKIEQRLHNLETNRTPQPLLVHQLQNAGPMSQVPHGHSTTYDETSGLYIPSPNQAAGILHMQGALQASVVSPPIHSRYATWIIGISADVGTYSSPFQFAVYLNKSLYQTFSVGNPINQWKPPGQLIPVQVDAYTTQITAEVVNAGTGNADLVVYFEWGSVVAGSVGPEGNAGSSLP